MDDLISRQSIKKKLQEHHDFLVEANEGWISPSVITKTRIDEISNCIAMVVNEPPVQPLKVIRCKDCNEWHKGKNHDESDVYSDEGYCSIHRIITGENYYCGDAERGE